MDNNRSTHNRRTTKDRRAEKEARVRRCIRTALPECSSRGTTRRRHRRASTRGSRCVTIARSGGGSISVDGRMTDDPVRSRRRHCFPPSLALRPSRTADTACTSHRLAYVLDARIESNRIPPRERGTADVLRPAAGDEPAQRRCAATAARLGSRLLRYLLWMFGGSTVVRTVSFSWLSRRRRCGRANAFGTLDSRLTASTACFKRGP